MAILFDAEKKIFKLDTASSSYVFAVHDSGRLLLLTDKQLYLADQNLSQLKPREGRGLFYVASVGNHLYGIAEEGLVYEGL